jgi:hypothetical protein
LALIFNREALFRIGLVGNAKAECLALTSIIAYREGLRAWFSREWYADDRILLTFESRKQHSLASVLRCHYVASRWHNGNATRDEE